VTFSSWKGSFGSLASWIWKGFLTRLRSISCVKSESPNMVSCLFYFHGSTTVLWFNCILDIFFYFYCKTTKYHYNS